MDDQNYKYKEIFLKNIMFNLDYIMHVNSSAMQCNSVPKTVLLSDLEWLMIPHDSIWISNFVSAVFIELKKEEDKIM